MNQQWYFSGEGEGPDSNLKESNMMMMNRLLKARKIVLSSEVNSKLADRIINLLILMEEEDKEKPIVIYINSPGGEVYSGFAIYDWMRSIQPPVYTVVSGFAASMGSIISLAGADGHKYAMPNAKVLIHQPLIAGVLRGTSTEIEIHAKEMLSIKERIVNIYAEKANRDVDTIRKDIERDKWLTAEEAKDYGLIDKIIKSQGEIGQ